MNDERSLTNKETGGLRNRRGRNIKFREMITWQAWGWASNGGQGRFMEIHFKSKKGLGAASSQV